MLVGDLEDQPDPLRAAADVWWHQVGAPRARVTVRRSSEVDDTLDAAAERLHDWPAQRRESHRGDEVAELLAGESDGHEGHDMGGHEGHDMGGHEGHDMGGHEGHDMGDVAGLPMAGTGDDRDGLALDLVTYRLGPFLHGWPVGLVVRTELSGDIVSSAVVEATPHLPQSLPRRAAVAHAVAEVLDLAGWGTASREVCRARTRLLDGEDLDVSHRRWIARVRRSRTLRWSLRGIGAQKGRDASDRMTDWCDLLLAPDPAPAGDLVLDVDPDEAVDAVLGTELARARIAVASLALHAIPTSTGRHPLHRGAPR